MIVIHPDGRVENVAYVDYKSIEKGVNPHGRDDPFTTVPIPERDAAGYTVFANDVGLLIGLDHNPWAEELCDYEPLVGPVVVASFEESKEDDLIGCIVPAKRKQFLQRLEDVCKASREHLSPKMN